MHDEANSIDIPKITESYDSAIIVRRWAATWIDLVILFLVAAGLNTIVGDLWRYAELALVLALFLGYYLLIEGLTGWTVGKLIVRVRVVDASGKLPSFGKALIRTAIRVFEVNPLLAGGLPAGVVAGFSKNKQRLGDIAADTYVVRTEDLVPGKNDDLAHTENTRPDPDFVCPSCEIELSIPMVIDSCVRSWPSTAMTSFECPGCKKEALLTFPKKQGDSGSRMIPSIQGLAFEAVENGISVSFKDQRWLIPKEPK